MLQQNHLLSEVERSQLARVAWSPMLCLAPNIGASQSPMSQESQSPTILFRGRGWIGEELMGTWDGGNTRAASTIVLLLATLREDCAAGGIAFYLQL